MHAPAWSLTAATLVDDVLNAGARITRLHLTPDQAAELKEYTGQTTLLFGYPAVLGGRGRLENDDHTASPSHLAARKSPNSGRCSRGVA